MGDTVIDVILLISVLGAIVTMFRSSWLVDEVDVVKERNEHLRDSVKVAGERLQAIRLRAARKKRDEERAER